jgi:hypothetical protein
VLLAAVAVADAATITQTVTINPTITDWNNSLMFQQFDSSLGTLQSVTIDLSAIYTTILTVTNNAASSSEGTATTQLQLTLTGGNGVGLAIDQTFPSPAFSYSLAPGGSTTSGTFQTTATATGVYSAAAILNDFTGSGSVTLPISTYTQAWLGNTGGVSSISQYTTAGLTGTATYTYAETNVPEPATLILMGVALLVIGLWRHMRRA